MTVDCPDHPGHEAKTRCAACNRPICPDCTTFELEGRVFCAVCGEKEEGRHHELGSLLLGVVAVGYLAALAVGAVVFRGGPVAGGIAAIVAIALGRVLQLLLRTRPAAAVTEPAKASEH